MDLTKEMLIELYRKMLTIRRFEEKAAELYKNGAIPGDVHLCIGQEAIAVGICACLRREDLITGTHRAHGQVFAKGADLKKMMAELFGKATGYCRGKGGSIHLADVDVGVLGANGIVGGSIAIGVGAALACLMKDTDNVAVAFFGDGASNRGTFHEAVNLAAIWKLPVVFVCENNFYAMSSYQRDAMAVQNVSERAVAYGIPGVSIDGNDVVAVWETGQEAVRRARQGQGPTLIEAITWRHHGHFEGENDVYRDPKEHEAWLKKDPVARFGDQLLRKHRVSDQELDRIEQAVRDEIQEAVEFAQKSPWPDAAELLEDIYNVRSDGNA
jgi:pyruvate dehydrogenase E1 component alpha subunit